MKPLQRLEGMTLRDYFAAKALPALLMNVSKMTKQQIEEYTPQEACALVAYLYADAMMEARNGKR